MNARGPRTRGWRSKLAGPDREPFIHDASKTIAVITRARASLRRVNTGRCCKARLQEFLEEYCWFATGMAATLDERVLDGVLDIDKTSTGEQLQIVAVDE